MLAPCSRTGKVRVLLSRRPDVQHKVANATLQRRAIVCGLAVTETPSIRTLYLPTFRWPGRPLVGEDLVLPGRRPCEKIGEKSELRRLCRKHVRVPGGSFPPEKMRLGFRCRGHCVSNSPFILIGKQARWQRRSETFFRFTGSPAGIAPSELSSAGKSICNVTQLVG